MSKVRMGHKIGFRQLAISISAFLLALCAGFASFSGTAVFAHSDVSQTTKVSLPQSTQSSDHVTIIVLDMSGSMLQNDPAGIRCSAANAYIDLSRIGSFIGVVGLDNNHGPRGGAHNFEQATVWAEPTEMATVAQRQGLEHAIASKSRNCAPDGSTPTYDALNQALTMLQSATHNGQISGSVILLTDGVPSPDTSQQVDTIKADLVPQFQQNHWPVDTIALGKAQDFAFLNDIANGSGGKFYDDAHGVVDNGGSPTPLNIAPFFVDIFAQRNGRTPGPDVAPTFLNGGSTSRDFQIGSYVDHLDVVAIKDQTDTTITLTAPNGQTIQPTTAGAFTATDLYQHYVIFSIDGPQQGRWNFTITGSGSFLMDSLVVSTLRVAIDSIDSGDSPAAKGSALPLGQNLIIKAELQDHGSQVTGSDFTVKATITFAGDLPFGAAAPTKTVLLSDSKSPGIYQGAVNVPQTAPAGSYEFRVAVTQITDVVIAEDSRIVRLELFPQPCLGACGPPPQTTAATVVQWDPITQVVYGLPVGIVEWLSQLPLNGLPARTEAKLAGKVYLKGAVYPNATVKVSATRKDASGKDIATPVSWVNDGQGRFHIILPYTGSGIYTLHFQTMGSYEDSHGEFGPTSVTVQPQLIAATPAQEARNVGVSLFYLLLLVFIALCIRFVVVPKPFGGLQLQPTSGDDYDEFAKVGRMPWTWLIHPNKIWAHEMGLESGVAFKFTREQIEAKNSGGYTLDGAKMPHSYSTVDGRDLTEPGQQGQTYRVMGKAETPPDEPEVDDENQPVERRGVFAGIKSLWGPSRTRGDAEDDDNNDYDNDYFSGPPPNTGKRVRKGRRQTRQADDAFDYEDY